MTWAQRLKRVFNIDVSSCGHCGGTVRIVASIKEPNAIRAIRCGVSCLAGCNVTAECLSAGVIKVAHFEGAPIPTSVVLTAVLAGIAWQRGLTLSLPRGAWELFGWTLHPLVLMFALAAARLACCRTQFSDRSGTALGQGADGRRGRGCSPGRVHR